KGDMSMLAEIRRLSTLADIRFVYQEEQLGLGHAVGVARDAIGNEPFMLFLPDDIFQFGEKVLRAMIDTYDKYSGSVIAVTPVSDEDVSRYGVIDPEPLDDRVYRIKQLVEKPPLAEAPSRLAIMGRYVLSPEIFEAIDVTPPGRGGEIQLTDALQILLRTRTMFGYEFEGKRYDTGTFPGWLETTVEMALQDPEIGPTFGRYLRNLLK
ncbi:MAG: UTP--glucose-1-phosphate uridylyltransferase, partial [Dehalococcoidales bacterium]|nr:UTP--glucose-1-phosphate uridylyltransferase [Dehalococcoidales bacterium]